MFLEGHHSESSHSDIDFQIINSTYLVFKNGVDVYFINLDGEELTKASLQLNEGRICSLQETESPRLVQIIYEETGHHHSEHGHETSWIITWDLKSNTEQSLIKVHESSHGTSRVFKGVTRAFNYLIPHAGD